MARKKEILTESEIRRFMKLASMAPVGDSRLHEMYGDPVFEQEDEELDVEAAPEPELEPEPGLEPEVELDAEEAGPPVDEEVATELAQGIADVMRDVLGVEVSVEGGEEEELGEPEMEMEPEMAPGLEPEEEAPLGGDELGAEEEELGLPPGNTAIRYENEDALVNEVAKRVAARLAKENKKAKTIDDLTERIFARLTKK